jgi:hypothetical protein
VTATLSHAATMIVTNIQSNVLFVASSENHLVQPAAAARLLCYWHGAMQTSLG